jgi:archaellum component FlaC
MSFEMAKAKGNDHFVSGRYEEAVKCYSESLSFQPHNHLALSNRSAAYAKLNLCQKAYDDAVQCVMLAPEFARGHLRKATALNGLGKYGEAMSAAEKCYRLRGSNRICKDSVVQWLKASTTVLENDVAKLQENIPGVSPVTATCYEILHEIEQLGSNPGGISVEVLQVLVHKTIKELETILGRFNHSLSPCMHQWATALIQSLKADPRTHAPPPATMELLKSKSKELVLWLDLEVDHLLYPVIRPVFGLLTLAMVTCASTLSHMISARSSIQILTKACLVFYRDSILSPGQYLRLHIHVLQCLLNSFCMEIGHNRQREDEIFEINNLTKELKSLLSQYDSSNADYASVKQRANLILDILCSTEDKTEQVKRLTKEDAEMLKRQVSLEVDKLTHDTSHLNFRDMDTLVLATGMYVASFPDNNSGPNVS